MPLSRLFWWENDVQNMNINTNDCDLRHAYVAVEKRVYGYVMLLASHIILVRTIRNKQKKAVFMRCILMEMYLKYI